MNKNTKQRKAALAESVKAGSRQVTFDRSYVQSHGNSYRNIEISVPREVSESPRRNMHQIVVVNADENGKKSSLTLHEPIHTDRPVKFKNHNYLDGLYKQPKGIRA